MVNRNRLKRRRDDRMEADENFKIEVIYIATGTRERPGGQHAGTPPSAVRVTHLPSGIMAQCGEQRSQHKNKATALEMVQWGLLACGWPA